MKDAHLFREAVFVELAGELDALVGRLEALPPAINALGDRVDQIAADIERKLNEATERHQVKLDALQAQATKTVGEYVVRRTNEAAINSIAEMETALLSIAHNAFAAELIPTCASSPRRYRERKARSLLPGRPGRSTR